MGLRLIACLIVFASGTAQGGVYDPPSRVARIRFVEGLATVHAAGGTAADAVIPNWPIAAGDRVDTGQQSQAELDLGDVLLRLADSSSLSLEELQPNMIRLGIARGVTDIDASELLHETMRIQLANASIQIVTPGAYRIEVRENGDARIVVHEGRVEIRAGQAIFGQRSNEEVAIAREGTFAIAPAAPREVADGRRLQKSQGARTAQHVAPALVGYRDLDDYGVWRWLPDYGMVWEPRVADDWTPYRFGRWIWKSPWGWTWVDDAPWGFAPFHFGRWARLGSRWVWVPGPRQVPATYAPALVRWVQAPGEHDSVGWYPLTVGEEYDPPYAATDRYKQNVNLFAVVSAGRALPSLTLTDRNAPAGLTWTSRAVFAHHPSPDLAIRTSEN
jgi:hypothetical protein